MLGLVASKDTGASVGSGSHPAGQLPQLCATPTRELSLLLHALWVAQSSFGIPKGIRSWKAVGSALCSSHGEVCLWARARPSGQQGAPAAPAGTGEMQVQERMAHLPSRPFPPAETLGSRPWRGPQALVTRSLPKAEQEALASVHASPRWLLRIQVLEKGQYQASRASEGDHPVVYVLRTMGPH